MSMSTIYRMLECARQKKVIINLRFATVATIAIFALQTGSLVRADSISVDYVKGQLPIASDSITKLGTDLFGDKVNLYNGALQFEHTDISIPGNNSLPVALSRSRDAGRSWNVRGAMADWDLNTPRIEGTFADYLGWQLANGGSRCSAFGALGMAAANGWAQTEGGTYRVIIDFFPWDYESGINITIPGQGSREILRKTGNPIAPSDGNSYPLVTKDNWQVGCLPSIQNGAGEGFMVVSPDGVKYRFDWMAERRQRPVAKDGAILGRKNLFLMATSVTDRFGNWVQYTYNPSSPLQLQRIDSSDGRFIALSYNGPYVASANDGSRTWQYSYSNFSVTGELRSLQLPDSSHWTFDLSGLAYMEDQVFDYYQDCDSLPQVASGNFVGRMTHPSGASGTFTTQFLQLGRTNVTRWCTYYPWGGYLSWTNGSVYPKTLVSQGLVSKVITGVGLSPMTWTYVDYSSPWGAWGPCATCADSKAVEVTDPMGYVTRYTYGNTWQVNEGQLLKLEEGWNGNSALRTTHYSYRNSTGQAFPDQIGESQLAVGDYLSSRNRPVQSKVISQQSVDFNWKVNAAPSGFDALARPLQVDRFSSLGYSVSDSITYHDNTSKWVLGQVKIVSIAGLENERTDFDPVTAMPTAKYSFGRPLYSMRYNADGTVWQLLDPVGRATSFQDYYRGIPRSFVARDGTTQGVGVNNIGRITSHTNSLGSTTSYGYDAIGRLARIDYPTEAWGSYHPTILTFEPVGQSEFGIPAGHWRQTVSTGNARTVRYFDALWQVGLTQTWDMANPPGTSRYITNRYDAFGHKLFESQPQRSIASVGDALPGKSWFYDALGRMVAQREDSEIGPLDTVTEYIAGFQRRVTNARGYAYTTAFHAFESPAEDAPAVIWAPEGVTASISRDAFGKPTSITRGGAWGGSGPASVTRSYSYDQHQRLCKTVEPESGATVQGYDGAGNISWRASGLGADNSCNSAAANRVISYGYDAMDQLTNTSYGDGSPGITRSYTLDGLLQQIVTQHPSSPIGWAYTYNSRRLLTRERYTWGDPTYGWNFDRAVNGYGHVSALTDPWGAMDYSPNALGEPTQVSGYASNVTYHPNGSIASYTLANNITHTTAINARGLPARITNIGITQDAYVYDANGNITSIADEQEGANNRKMTAYDGLDRLREANGPWGVGIFYYGALDNLRRSTVGARDLWHNYNDANRLASVTGTQTLGFSYDANGNITERGGQQFTFDVGNRMVGAPGKANYYLYDGHGRRNIVWYADGRWMHQAYTNDGKLRFAWRNNEGHTRHVYLGNNLIAETVEGGATTFAHYDALGSPTAKTNGSGGLVSRTRYEPYGATVAGSTNPTKIGFTGHVNDADTGLVYMQQRYYDPIAGRFLSVDPVTTDANTGIAFNRYAYAKNSPYNFVDPNGEDPEAPSPVRPIPAPADPKILGQAIYKILDTLSQPLQQALNSVIQNASDGPKPPDPKSGGEKDPADKSGELTKAGRAQQKHGDRAGSAFDPATGTPADKNAQGQKTLDTIVGSPDRVQESSGRGGTDVRQAPDGRGARFDEKGKFTGFIEPRRP